MLLTSLFNLAQNQLRILIVTMKRKMTLNKKKCTCTINVFFAQAWHACLGEWLLTGILELIEEVTMSTSEDETWKYHWAWWNIIFLSLQYIFVHITKSYFLYRRNLPKLRSYAQGPLIVNLWTCSSQVLSMMVIDFNDHVMMMMMMI